MMGMALVTKHIGNLSKKVKNYDRLYKLLISMEKEF